METDGTADPIAPCQSFTRGVVHQQQARLANIVTRACLASRGELPLQGIILPIFSHRFRTSLLAFVAILRAFVLDKSSDA